MSKRSIIICTVVALLLLAGIGWLFCTLFFGDSAENAGTDRLTDGVEAVPSDAIFLFSSSSLSSSSSFFSFFLSLFLLLSFLPSPSSSFSSSLSLPSSPPPSFSPLLFFSLQAVHTRA